MIKIINKCISRSILMFNVLIGKYIFIDNNTDVPVLYAGNNNQNEVKSVVVTLMKQLYSIE